MDKKIKKILISVIIVLFSLNVFLLVVFFINQRKMVEMHQIIKSHEVDLLSLNDKQRDCIKGVCTNLLVKEDFSVNRINELHDQLIQEVSKDDINVKSIDSIESQMMDFYKELVHETAMQYKSITEYLNEEQIEKLKPLYFDMFLRMYSPNINTHLKPETQKK